MRVLNFNIRKKDSSSLQLSFRQGVKPFKNVYVFSLKEIEHEEDAHLIREFFSQKIERTEQGFLVTASYSKDSGETIEVNLLNKNRSSKNYSASEENKLDYFECSDLMIEQGSFKLYQEQRDLSVRQDIYLYDILEMIEKIIKKINFSQIRKYSEKDLFHLVKKIVKIQNKKEELIAVKRYLADKFFQMRKSIQRKELKKLNRECSLLDSLEKAMIATQEKDLVSIGAKKLFAQENSFKNLYIRNLEKKFPLLSKIMKLEKPESYFVSMSRAETLSKIIPIIQESIILTKKYLFKETQEKTKSKKFKIIDRMQAKLEQNLVKLKNECYSIHNDSSLGLESLVRDFIQYEKNLIENIQKSILVQEINKKNKTVQDIQRYILMWYQETQSLKTRDLSTESIVLSEAKNILRYKEFKETQESECKKGFDNLRKYLKNLRDISLEIKEQEENLESLKVENGFSFYQEGHELLLDEDLLLFYDLAKKKEKIIKDKTYSIEDEFKYKSVLHFISMKDFSGKKESFKEFLSCFLQEKTCEATKVLIMNEKTEEFSALNIKGLGKIVVSSYEDKKKEEIFFQEKESSFLSLQKSENTNKIPEVPIPSPKENEYKIDKQTGDNLKLQEMLSMLNGWKN